MTGALTSVVVDSSVVVAALVDSSAEGQWALDALTSGPLVCPHLMPFEVVNVLRRMVLRGVIDPSEGSSAAHDMSRLAVDLVPFAPLQDRVWELRDNVTGYDAAYVATAELVGGSLLTLDRRLAAAPGVRCEISTGP